MTDRLVENTPLSRGLRHLGGLASGAGTAALVVAVVIAWLVASAIAGFPPWMAAGLQTTAAAVTLVMVFVIQHAQRRTEAAIQLKLDALIRASGASNEVAEIEMAEGDELERLREHGAELSG